MFTEQKNVKLAAPGNSATKAIQATDPIKRTAGNQKRPRSHVRGEIFGENGTLGEKSLGKMAR